MQRARGRSAAAVAGIVAVGLMSGGSAIAATNLYSYKGANFSRDTNGTSVMACDREADGRAVHADYKRLGSGTTQIIKDGDGSAVGTCAGTGTSTTYPITQHRIVVEIPVLPDEQGPWRYPS